MSQVKIQQFLISQTHQSVCWSSMMRTVLLRSLVSAFIVDQRTDWWVWEIRNCWILN